ncbi:MAG: TRAP transporter substrate-binding protein [Rhodospirillales bacterium]|nr:TRAP transporter substrate-binding protein [Rhodospirillales bacterium]
MPFSLSRKQFVGGAVATLGLTAFLPRRARSAPNRFRLGCDIPPDHPIGTHLVAAAKNVGSATNGQVEIDVFLNNELGDDTHMLAQLRSGVIEFMAVGDNILAELVPSVAIDNIGFAFKDATTAFAALDGTVGDITRADMHKTGLHAMPKIWDEGFREITSSTKPIKTPQDLRGFKIRVPPSPISLSLFKDLGASPLTLNATELYTALQTHLADGQENPLGTIEANKFYEVQKYCSLTNHMWVGYWVVANLQAWNRIPGHLQGIIENAFDAEVPAQRSETEHLNNSLIPKLESQGLTFNRPDIAPFRQALIRSGFYTHWQTQFGTTLWAALEKYSGPIG